jgi:hypothetical protein
MFSAIVSRVGPGEVDLLHLNFFGLFLNKFDVFLYHSIAL